MKEGVRLTVLSCGLKVLSTANGDESTFGISTDGGYIGQCTIRTNRRSSFGGGVIEGSDGGRCKLVEDKEDENDQKKPFKERKRGRKRRVCTVV